MVGDSVKRVKIGKKVEVIRYEQERRDSSPDTNEIAEAQRRDRKGAGKVAANSKKITEAAKKSNKKKPITPSESSFSDDEMYSDEYDDEEYSEVEPIDIVSSESSLDVQDFDFLTSEKFFEQMQSALQRNEEGSHLKTMISNIK